MERVFRQTMGGIQKVVQSPRSNSEAWVRSGLSGEEPSVEKLFDTTVVYTMIQLRDLFETENWYKETTPLMFWELEFTIMLLNAHIQLFPLSKCRPKFHNG